MPVSTPLPEGHPFALVYAQAAALLLEQGDPIANAANMSALIFNQIEHLNWAGFYFRQGQTLIVGPFQGQPACVEIAWGKGVCGTAAATNQTQRVDDVHEFDGHIACDAASRSEVVVPLVRDGAVFGVLDIDSPNLARFSATEQQGFEALAALYTQRSRAIA
ncbi:MAG: GAF domain-containing protein [Gammaproteobacteria bacterium]